jgi:uncharacterized protein YvpB
MSSQQKKVEGVPIIGQYPELPTGCEATALTMLLNWAGVEVEKREVAQSLPKESTPREQAGVMVGGHPNRAFIGDPFTADSYGVFHQPIAKLLDSYLPGRALDLTGITFDELLAISVSRPVVVWATIELKKPRVVITWRDEQTHELIHWQSPEHCMTLVGYDQEHVLIHDPHTGGCEAYERDLFQNRWEQLGCQAVTVTLEE